jgi:hypothetical protein
MSQVLMGSSTGLYRQLTGVASRDWRHRTSAGESQTQRGRPPMSSRSTLFDGLSGGFFGSSLWAKQGPSEFIKTVKYSLAIVGLEVR